MKPSIYYGNIVSHVVPQPIIRPLSEVTSNTITFTGFDLTPAVDFQQRLDLLFYNRVNEIGEVLSSLVYISNPLDLDDLDIDMNPAMKTYDLKKLYTNTDTEISMVMTPALKDFTYFNCKWATSKFFTSSISPLFAVRHEELAANGKPSVKLEQYGTSFDGWYTQMSVAVKEILAPIAPVKKGLIGLHDFSSEGLVIAVLLEDEPVDITADSVWSPITVIRTDGTTNPDGSILVPGTSIANVLVTLSLDNPYIKQDLFILPTYLSLYDNSVIQYAEYPTYGNPFPVLRDKHRIIHNFASENDFLEAQYMLQTTEYFRAVTK